MLMPALPTSLSWATSNGRPELAEGMSALAVPMLFVGFLGGVLADRTIHELD